MTGETPVEPAPKRRRWFRGRALLVVLGAAVVVGGAALVGLWEASTSPLLCNSCHIMKPYVAAWKASKHRNVTCVQCHYPPGFRDTIWVKYQAISQVVKWATQTYNSKPFAEVEDASCLRSGCHERRLMEGKVHVQAWHHFRPSAASPGGPPGPAAPMHELPFPDRGRNATSR